jgi:hypothetical protein
MTRIPVVLSLLLSLALPAAAGAQSDLGAARSGASWLTRAVGAGGDGAAADAVVALRAAGRLSGGEAARRAAGLRRGVGSYARTAGATAKLVLGLQAATGRGRCAGRTDLLRRIAGFGRSGRYGSTVFDQALSMLAFRATGNRPPSSTVRFLLAARGAGGWNFALSPRGADNVSSTGLAIQALRAAGVSSRDGRLRAALAWLRAQRTPGGGFADGRRDRNEANPTAIALLAQRAMGARDTRAVRVLRGLRRSDGSFQFTRTDAGSRILATNDAVLALSGATLPVRRGSRPQTGC